MSNRYEVITAWETDSRDRQPTVIGDTLIVIQTADIRDNQGRGHIYRNGAYRVVSGTFVDDDVQTKDLKPVKVGKGGTVPFLGELAWSDAVRLFEDTITKIQYAR